MRANKTMRAALRLTPQEHARLRHEAGRRGLSLSAHLRSKALQTSTAPAVNVDAAALRDLLRQVKGAATNINQIARRYNEGHADAALDDALAACLDRLSSAAHAVADLLTMVRR